MPDPKDLGHLVVDSQGQIVSSTTSYDHIQDLLAAEKVVIVGRGAESTSSVNPLDQRIRFLTDISPDDITFLDDDINIVITGSLDTSIWTRIRSDPQLSESTISGIAAENTKLAQEFAKVLRARSHNWSDPNVNSHAYETDIDEAGAQVDKPIYYDSKRWFSYLYLVALAERWGIPLIIKQAEIEGVGLHWLQVAKLPPQYNETSHCWEVIVVNSLTGGLETSPIKDWDPDQARTVSDMVVQLHSKGNIACSSHAIKLLNELADQGHEYDFTQIHPRAFVQAKTAKTQDLSVDSYNCGGFSLWYAAILWSALDKPQGISDPFLTPFSYNGDTETPDIPGRQRLLKDTGIFLASDEDLSQAMREGLEQAYQY